MKFGDIVSFPIMHHEITLRPIII
uniref:Uncharacterized protein n=1 Tax=Acrobeloides nanus TaxID=290746 RepID=A0A914DAU1_9BILA